MQSYVGPGDLAEQFWLTAAHHARVGAGVGRAVGRAVVGRLVGRAVHCLVPCGQLPLTLLWHTPLPCLHAPCVVPKQPEQAPLKGVGRFVGRSEGARVGASDAPRLLGAAVEGLPVGCRVGRAVQNFVPVGHLPWTLL